MFLRRKLMIPVLIALLVVGVVASMQALPSGSSGFDIIYYSDESHSEVVGERYMGCTGGVDRWGAITNYQDSFSWECNDGGSSGGMSCTVTTCQETFDANGNSWYWDCHTETNSGEPCFWKMCNTGGHCD